MGGQRAALSAGVVTELASERSFSGVDPNVQFQVTCEAENRREMLQNNLKQDNPREQGFVRGTYTLNINLIARRNSADERSTSRHIPPSFHMIISI